MKIYSTGFLHENYKSNLNKHSISVRCDVLDFHNDRCFAPVNISFKSSFFNWDSIKKMFQTKKQKEKIALEQNNLIDFSTAQKIFLEAIKKENLKCSSNITKKLFADAENCTPNKATVYAGLYNIFLKHEKVVNFHLYRKFKNLQIVL